MAGLHPVDVAYRHMVATNTRDVAVLLVRRDWQPRPTPIAHALLQIRQALAPTWLQQHLAGV